MPEPRPLLVIVTGRPGSGKTTLARALADRFGYTIVSRDELKEELLGDIGTGASRHGAGNAVLEDTLNESRHSEPSERIQSLATNAFFAEILARVQGGAQLVAEAAFQHRVWSTRLKPIFGIADVRIVVCEVPTELARKRVEERMRLDPEWIKRHPFPSGQVGPSPDYDPPGLDVPTLFVETTAGYVPSLDAIGVFLQ